MIYNKRRETTPIFMVCLQRVLARLTPVTSRERVCVCLPPPCVLLVSYILLGQVCNIFGCCHSSNEKFIRLILLVLLKYSVYSIFKSILSLVKNCSWRLWRGSRNKKYLSSHRSHTPAGIGNLGQNSYGWIWLSITRSVYSNEYLCTFLFTIRRMLWTISWLFITAELNAADEKICWQALLLTYVSLLQIPSANASLIISVLRNMSVRFCWCYLSAYWNVTRRLADYQPVTKRISTFLLMLFIISIYYSYLFMAFIHRMHNNSVCQGLEKTTFLLPCANFTQKKYFVFLTCFDLLLPLSKVAAYRMCKYLV